MLSALVRFREESSRADGQESEHGPNKPFEMTRGLPHGEEAVLDIRKLEDYCLSPTHPRGRHKARVFRGALDIGRADAAWLRDVLLQAAQNNEASRLTTDEWGAQWRVDVGVEHHEESAVVRTIWIVRTGETAPRFVTCWVL